MDRSLALEWQAEQDTTCSGCGNPLDECMDSRHDGAYTVRKLVCYSCQASQQEQRKDEERGVDVSGRRYIALLDGEVDDA